MGRPGGIFACRGTSRSLADDRRTTEQALREE